MDSNQAKIKAKIVDLDLIGKLEKIDNDFEHRGLATGGSHRRARAVANIRAQHEKDLLFAESNISSNPASTNVAITPHSWTPSPSEHKGMLKIHSNGEEIVFRSSYFGGLNEFFKNPDLTTSRHSLKTGIVRHLQGGGKNAGEVSITQWKSDLKKSHSQLFKYFDIVSVQDVYKLQPK